MGFAYVLLYPQGSVCVVACVLCVCVSVHAQMCWRQLCMPLCQGFLMWSFLCVSVIVPRHTCVCIFGPGLYV